MKRRKRKTRGFGIESLESRTMFALAGQVVAYIPDYEFAGSFSKIDLSAVTQLNYFSIVASGTGALGTQSSSGFNFSQLTSVVNAAHAASPRVSVSITLDPASQFQTIANSSSITTTFITNILAFCSSFHLDGIDLDYEPGTLTSTQKNSWGSFLASLHAQTSANHLTLSAAVQASQMIVPPAFIPDLDWYYLMDYDLLTNSSAPFSQSIMYLTNWTNYGVPKSQLVVGVPFYGRAGTNPNFSDSTTLSYSAILNGYAAANGGTLPGTNVDTITISGKTYGFNSVSDMQQKAQYILQNGYAGMMIWELGQDHYNGSGYDSLSLLPAIKTALTVPVTASAGAVYSLSSTALNITSGTVSVTGDVTTIDPNLAITVGGGATLNIGSGARLPALSLNGGSATVIPGSGTVVFGSLAITNGGLLDLTNNVMIAKNTTASTLFNPLKSGFNAGAGYWNGLSGIVSSTAHNDTSFLTTLGYRQGNGTAFGGVVAATGDAVVKFTYYGDSDLNGIVNGADYQQIDSGFGNHLTGWSNGDFNYDGSVDGSDFSLIDNTFNQITAMSASALAIVANVPVVHQAMAVNVISESDTSSWLDEATTKHKAKTSLFDSDETPAVLH